MNRKFLFGWAIILALYAMGCATPVGVKPADEKVVYGKLAANPLSSEQTSPSSAQLLARLGLAERFKKDPRGTLDDLHKGLGGPDEQDRLFALAELSYLHAKQSRDPQYYLAAAVYSYVFLFPENQRDAPLQYDPRIRIAMDLYNRGITNGLRSARGREIDLKSRRLSLPFGQMNLSAQQSIFAFGQYRLGSFVSVGDYTIHGLRNHYRKAGIGVALAARAKPIVGRTAVSWIPPEARFPVNAFVRFDQPRRELAEGRMTAKLEISDTDVSPTINIGRRLVPLESDSSAALAYWLNGSPIWDFEIAGFRRGDLNPFGGNNQSGPLYFLSPYRPGRIPVVFVHGTASSPARWAEMLNELLSDPNIAARYQFWYFIYNSGNAIPLSSMHLRESLEAALEGIDPAHRDPALRKMVVIGHSQGGLLAKMTSISSGTQFWANISEEPFEKANLSVDTRDLMRRSMFIEPLPFVRRLIFIATPHRGSYVAENIIGNIGRRLITLPGALSRAGVELVKLNPIQAARKPLQVPTAIDNMRWTNPYLRTLSSIPVAPGVEAHSIIAVKGNGPAEKGKDGVVRYASAHLDDAKTEFVVRSGHSCQSNPNAIEEVRRILYEHAGEPAVSTRPNPLAQESEPAKSQSAN